MWVNIRSTHTKDINPHPLQFQTPHGGGYPPRRRNLTRAKVWRRLLVLIVWSGGVSNANDEDNRGETYGLQGCWDC
ncbi:hypothetical protein Trydic_g18171 [Trypoxylus dichotomus]